MPTEHRAIRSAVVVEVPALDAVLDPYRARLDPSHALGVPAHVTLLYPFVPLDRLDAAVAALATAFEGLAAFDVEFSTTAWFGRQVLWLAPAPSAPFAELTARVRAAFPMLPPYSGGVAEPIPHLTVADGAASDAMEQAEPELRALLPLSARVIEISVMAGTRAPRSWSTLARLSLTG